MACAATTIAPRAASSTSRRWYRASSGVLYLQAVDSKRPVDLVLLRHAGLSPASVRVLDANGRLAASRSLEATGEPLQYARLRFGPGGPYRVELESRETRAWDLITAEPARRVFHVPAWKHLEALTPRLYFRTAPGARQIRLRFEAEGEGFKGAVVYDPRGNVTGLLSQFIEYDDTKHHSYDLAVSVREGSESGLWSLDLQDVSVSRAEGMTPYVSTSPAAYFIPVPARR
jgi:hypothetical protein